MTRTPLQTSLDAYEVWFLTGSQHLYGPETLAQVAEQSQRIAETLDAASDVPVKIVWLPVLTDSAAIKKVVEMHVDPKNDKSETYLDRIKASKWPGGELKQLMEEPKEADKDEKKDEAK